MANSGTGRCHLSLGGLNFSCQDLCQMGHGNGPNPHGETPFGVCQKLRYSERRSGMKMSSHLDTGTETVWPPYDTCTTIGPPSTIFVTRTRVTSKRVNSENRKKVRVDIHTHLSSQLVECYGTLATNESAPWSGFTRSFLLCKNTIHSLRASQIETCLRGRSVTPWGCCYIWTDPRSHGESCITFNLG